MVTHKHWHFGTEPLSPFHSFPQWYWTKSCSLHAIYPLFAWCEIFKKIPAQRNPKKLPKIDNPSDSYVTRTATSHQFSTHAPQLTKNKYTAKQPWQSNEEKNQQNHVFINHRRPFLFSERTNEIIKRWKRLFASSLVITDLDINK